CRGSMFIGASSWNLRSPIIAAASLSAPGILIEFASAVDAARCAVEIQHGMIKRSASVPQDKRIEFRIGIHVGDVGVAGLILVLTSIYLVMPPRGRIRPRHALIGGI